MNKIIDLNFWQMASSYIFVIILMVFVRLKGISREKEILISSIRMTLQLILTGYLLNYIFDYQSVLITSLVLIIMEAFAIHNIIKRSKKKLSKNLKKIIAMSMAIGTLVSIFYFLLVVVRISPWYKAQYFIPVSGMLIGNSMTGISLGVNQLINKMEDKKDLIEAALMLGASPKMASKDVINQAFDSAILPTINSMLGMGIVFLPGMMTGQILSGISPLTAISYQIAIMLGILGSVSLSLMIFTNLAYKTFFNKEMQLVFEEK